jgi:hypothetical protein
MLSEMPCLCSLPCYSLIELPRIALLTNMVIHGMMPGRTTSLLTCLLAAPSHECRLPGDSHIELPCNEVTDQDLKFARTVSLSLLFALLLLPCVQAAR